MLLVYFVIVPIFAGVILYLLPKKILVPFISLVQASLFYFVIKLYGEIVRNGDLHYVIGAPSDTPTLGIVLKGNSLNVVFLTLTIFLFTCAIVYTMREEFFGKKFSMLFLILEGLLSGIFLTDDLFNIFVLLEVATIVVAILIMFKRDSRSVYDGMIYLLSQVVCMVFYLFGIGYLYKIFGVLSIDAISKTIHNVEVEQLILPYAFIMTAVCLKSAIFPLFSWLPRAHGTPSAPSAVSAILSGLYVKNGIYLFFIFSNLFYPVIDYTLFFTVVSAITAIAGFSLSLIQTDIKLVLAFSTVSQMGLIALGLSIPSETSMIGSMYHIINHAVFKSLLFLSAGMIIKKYDTRNINNMRGVLKTMPITGTCTLIASLAITGAPFMNGSISKYFIQYGAKGSFLEYLIIFINFGTILVFVKYTWMLWGKKENLPHTKQVGRKKIVLILLSLVCILGGVYGVQNVNYFMNSNLSINPVDYIEKCIIYSVSVFVAVLLYKYFISNNKKIYKYNVFSLNFQQIIMAMIVLFISIVSVTYIQTM